MTVFALSWRVQVKMAEIVDLNKPKVFVREGELYDRITKLLDEYAGDLSVVAALGVLELAKDYIKGQS